jgi:hypothetical protein
MPKYYVELEPGGAKDEDGEWLPGPSAAKRLIEAMAEELTKNHRDVRYERIVVKNEDGEIVHETPLVTH